VIVASPPCQAYSYRRMPWGALWREHNRMDDDGGPPGNYRGKDPIFNDLFLACFRIAREAGLPVIVENVKGAQDFVGPAAWHYGNFYLWGDVPAIWPVTLRKRKSKHKPTAETPEGTGKTSWFYGKGRSYGMKGGNGTWFNIAHGERREGNTAGNPIRGDGLKGDTRSWSDYGKPGYKPEGFNTKNAQRWREEQANGVKCHGQKHGTEYAMTRGPVDNGGTKVSGDWFGSAAMKANGTISPGRLHGKNSDSRKAASAQIAKIPFPLAQHIARVFKP